MVVAVPRGALVAQNGQKWPKMALHLTKYCDMAISHVLAHPARPRRPRRSFPSCRACRAILSTCEISRGSVSRFAATRRGAFCAPGYTKKRSSSTRGETSARRHERHEQPTGQTVKVNGANPSLRRNTAKQGVFSLNRLAREKLCPRSLVCPVFRVPGVPNDPNSSLPVCPAVPKPKYPRPEFTRFGVFLFQSSAARRQAVPRPA